MRVHDVDPGQAGLTLRRMRIKIATNREGNHFEIELERQSTCALVGEYGSVFSEESSLVRETKKHANECRNDF